MLELVDPPSARAVPMRKPAKRAFLGLAGSPFAPEPPQAAPEPKVPLTNAERQRLYRERHGDSYRNANRQRMEAARAVQKAAKELPVQLKKWNKALAKAGLSVNSGLFIPNAPCGRGCPLQLSPNVYLQGKAAAVEAALVAGTRAGLAPDILEVYVADASRGSNDGGRVGPRGCGPDADETPDPHDKINADGPSIKAFKPHLGDKRYRLDRRQQRVENSLKKYAGTLAALHATEDRQLNEEFLRRLESGPIKNEPVTHKSKRHGEPC
jgi:hypothetical protein